MAGFRLSARRRAERGTVAGLGQVVELFRQPGSAVPATVAHQLAVVGQQCAAPGFTGGCVVEVDARRRYEVDDVGPGPVPAGLGITGVGPQREDRGADRPRARAATRSGVSQREEFFPSGRRRVASDHSTTSAPYRMKAQPTCTRRVSRQSCRPQPRSFHPCRPFERLTRNAGNRASTVPRITRPSVHQTVDQGAPDALLDHAGQGFRFGSLMFREAQNGDEAGNASHETAIVRW